MSEEHVLVVPADLISSLGHLEGFEVDVERFLVPILASDQLSYRPRSEMESDPNFKQLIPYVVMQWTDPNDGLVRVFTYTRGGGSGETRLHAKRSIGVGGHISSEDADGDEDPYLTGMRRELDEEVTIMGDYTDHQEGLLYDPSNEVGRVHLGVIHRFTLDQPSVTSNEAELAEGEFLTLAQLRSQYDTLETWSQLCLDALFPQALSMQSQQTIDRLVNLMDPDANVLLNETAESAAEIVRSGDRERISKIEGQFAICEKDGRTVRMVRTIGRPMRYFMAKLKAGPCLIVAERIDEIADWLGREGLRDQFDPSYTRMVPAHYLIELQLVGCPDPNPVHQRFFTPERNRLPADIPTIGHEYITRLARVCDAWLDRISDSEPIGVLFSGGIDSGAVLCVLYDLLLRRGQAPTRLKAFTLAIDGQSADFKQAAEFASKCGFPELLEVVEVPVERVDWRRAIQLVEDYKPLDIQSATFATALVEAIRDRYPDWRWLVDGDGGDENLKDYPIEENPELTIRSVLNNLMLYQEGWGVDSIKHSLTYSGGQSRGHSRSSAVARSFNFSGFSPFAVPSVIEVAEAIPFIDLTDWNHESLYRLKGSVVAAGVKSVTGIEMPIFEKRRFQHGAVSRDTFDRIFPQSALEYRQAFRQLCT